MTTEPPSVRGQPGVAAITMAPGAGGIAYTARLVHRAVAEIWDREPWTLTLDPARTGAVSLRERARFAARLVAGQLAGGVSRLVFDHVGIARVQALVPRRVRAPYVVLLYDRDAWSPDLAPARKEALRRAAARIAVSRFTAERVRRAHPDVGPVWECPLALLPPGDDQGVVDRGLLARVAPRSALIVSRISSADRYKGHDELLSCWRRVVEATGGAQLVVAGTGDDLPRLERKARDLGIAEHVLFTGFVPDATLQALLRTVSVFVMPSRGEGFGLVYLEAMRAGLPCIASDRDAAREVVVHGETGFLVDPDDPEALVSAVAALVTAGAGAREMGAAGRGRFEAQYSFPSFRARFGALLEEAFGAPAPPNGSGLP